MNINVPIDWNNNQNFATCTKTIKIFLKRYFISENKYSSHHLWRVAGYLSFAFQINTRFY